MVVFVQFSVKVKEDCTWLQKWISYAHIWGANVQGEEQTFPTLQPLPTCPQNWLSYGLTNICDAINSFVACGE